MPPIIAYHTNSARREWGLFALFILASAVACAAFGFALGRDEVRAARARAEYEARTLVERFAAAAATPGSDVALILTPLAAAAPPDLAFAVVEEHEGGEFADMSDSRYLGHSDPAKAGQQLDPGNPDDRRVMDLVAFAHGRAPGRAAYLWTRGEVSAVALGPSGVAAVVEGLRPRPLSKRPRTIALMAFGMLVLFAAGLHDVLPSVGRYVNLIVLALAVAVLTLLGKALEPSLWRGMADDALVGRAGALKLPDLVRMLSVDLPVATSAVVAWGTKIAAAASLFYAVALTGIFHRLSRFVRREALAYRLAAPAFGLVVVLAAIPMAVAAALSLFRATPAERTFVGLGNFGAVLLADPANPTSLWRVLLPDLAWIGASAVLAVGFALAAVALVAPLSRGSRRLYRTLLFIPWALPAPVAALLWSHALRLPAVSAWLPPDWSATFAGAFAASLGENVWRGTSFFAVLGLAALDQLPEDAIAALRAEGVRGLMLVRRLVIPFLRPLLLPALALEALGSVNAFAAVSLVTGGAPGGATDLLVNRAYRWAFERYELGCAAVWSLASFAVALWLARIFMRSLRALQPAAPPVPETPIAAPAWVAEVA